MMFAAEMQDMRIRFENPRPDTPIGKQIISNEVLACAGKDVRGEESADGGIVVAALEVIEPGFVVVVIATVVEGVDGCQLACCTQYIAPGVVGVGGSQGVVRGFVDSDHITLQILHEVVSALQVVQSELYFVDEAISVFPAKLTSVFP